MWFEVRGGPVPPPFMCHSCRSANQRGEEEKRDFEKGLSRPNFPISHKCIGVRSWGSRSFGFLAQAIVKLLSLHKNIDANKKGEDRWNTANHKPERRTGQNASSFIP